MTGWEGWEADVAEWFGWGGGPEVDFHLAREIARQRARVEYVPEEPPAQGLPTHGEMRRGRGPAPVPETYAACVARREAARAERVAAADALEATLRARAAAVVAALEARS